MDRLNRENPWFRAVCYSLVYLTGFVALFSLTRAQQVRDSMVIVTHDSDFPSLPLNPQVPNANHKTNTTTCDLDVHCETLLSKFVPLLSEDQLLAFARQCIMLNGPSRALELLLTTSDTYVLDLVKELLSLNSSPSVLRALLVSFEAEKDPARRAALAYAIGGNAWDRGAAMAAVEIVKSEEWPIVESALTRLQIGVTSSDIREVLAEMLRELSIEGPTSDIQARAISALKGDESPSTLYLLLDIIYSNPKLQMQLNAIGALPRTLSTLPDEMACMRSLLDLVLDQTRNATVRQQLADWMLQALWRVSAEEGFDSTSRIILEVISKTQPNSP